MIQNPKRALARKLAVGAALVVAAVLAGVAIYGAVRGPAQPPRQGATLALDSMFAADSGMVSLACGPGRRCDFSVGDTPCASRLPLLCYQPALPGQSTIPEGRYKGWTAASWAAAPAVRGDQLSSLEAASALCRTAFGERWTVARHFGAADSDGAQRGVRGQGFGETGSRYWVAVNDHPANCWNPAP